MAKSTQDISEQQKKGLKVIRHTFTLPEEDFNLIDQAIDRALSNKHVVNKSEVIRAGLIFLAQLSDEELLNALKQVKKIKVGRSKPEL